MVVSKAKKSAYHHGNLGPALLRAASDLLQQQGHEALSLRAVARKAGVSHTAAYHHFVSKEALLQALAEDGFNRLARALENAPVPTSAQAHLEAMGVAYVEFAVGHGALFRLMFSREASGGTRSASLQQASEKAFEILLSQVRAVAPSLPLARARAMAVHAWSITHGLSFLILDEQLNLVGIPKGGVTQLARAILTLQPLPSTEKR